MPRYATLAELKEGYDSGEIPNDNPLTLDNDSCSVYVNDELVYEGPGYEIREEALTLLGIPWEPV
jgi:hypothetical protein